MNRNYNSQECFAYLYVAFAHITEKNFHPAETDNIREKIRRWTGKESDNDFSEQIMLQALSNLTQDVDKGSVGQTIKNIALFLHDLPWFASNLKMLVACDLINIALADNAFGDTEKELMRTISNCWGVEVEI